ncbi:MAG TPA: hypothetical protein VN256_11890 [Pyrinomonadaceae bacterium]|nr:hypothetical protein [Pyrinomonadaceae bacterium]
MIARAVASFALMVFGVFSHAVAQGEVSKFRYRPERIVVGTVYHYVKTNLDGTHPEYVSIYVAARDQIESYKFHPNTERAGLVTARMDWETFSARRLESWQVFAGGEKKLFATLSFLRALMAAEVSIPATGKPPERTAIKHLPFHVYNFDLASLNFAFRHLVNPKGRFVVGIADPTFQEGGPLFAYRGEAEIIYAGEEVREGAPCRKYKIDGAGLSGRGGHIWVDKRGGFFRDVEIELPDNPNWHSFKFRLTSTERMTREGWERFMLSQLAPRQENAR